MAFAHHREECDNKTEMVFFAGALACVVGTYLIASPVGMVSSSAQMWSSVATGAGIAYESQQEAKGQLQSTIKQRSAHVSKDGKSDVTI